MASFKTPMGTFTTVWYYFTENNKITVVKSGGMNVRSTLLTNKRMECFLKNSATVFTMVCYAKMMVFAETGK